MYTILYSTLMTTAANYRVAWLEAIEGVKKRLESSKEVGGVGSGPEEEMREEGDATDPFETIFAKRGEVQKRSGSKKVVSTSTV